MCSIVPQMTKSTITIISTLLQWTPESNFPNQWAIILGAKTLLIKVHLLKIVLILARFSQLTKHLPHMERKGTESWRSAPKKLTRWSSPGPKWIRSVVWRLTTISACSRSRSDFSTKPMRDAKPFRRAPAGCQIKILVVKLTIWTWWLARPISDNSWMTQRH